MAINVDLSDLPRASTGKVLGMVRREPGRWGGGRVTATLFDSLPVRASDPQTSHDGAAMMHLSAQRLAVLTALVALGDATAWDVARRLDGPESGTVRSRLSQLHRAGLAHKVGVAAGDRGAPNTVWSATAAGAACVAAVGGVTQDRVVVS